MQFAERFIRRPVLSSMVSLGLVLVGFVVLFYAITIVKMLD